MERTMNRKVGASAYTLISTQPRTTKLPNPIKDPGEKASEVEDLLVLFISSIAKNTARTV